MRVLFLDFDGVLNSKQSVMYHMERNTQYDTIFFGDWCPIACSNLQILLKKTPDLKIVVSSSWRHGRTLDELKEILQAQGIDSSRIIDKTPKESPNGSKRGYEIKDWLDAHPEVKTYVIVDDDNDMLPSQKKFFVNTDSDLGFMLHDAKKAYTILGESGSLFGIIL